MEQHRRQHWHATEHYLGLCLAVTLGLVLGAQATMAKACHRETPLPADVRLSAPGLQVLEAVARFAGVWSGEWENTDGFCHTLVVEEVFANGFARVIYSHGASLTLNVSLCSPAFCTPLACARAREGHPSNPA